MRPVRVVLISAMDSLMLEGCTNPYVAFFENCGSVHNYCSSPLQDPTFNHYRFKRAMGTPSSQIVSVNENTPGAMLDRYGQLVIRAVDL